jgi:hypothetical protein
LIDRVASCATRSSTPTRSTCARRRFIAAEAIAALNRK